MRAVMSRLTDILDDYGEVLLVSFVSVGLIIAALALPVLLGSRAKLSPAPHNRVATVGDGIEVYRIGVPTADGRVAECLVTSLGGIHCFDQVEDAW